MASHAPKSSPTTDSPLSTEKLRVVAVIENLNLAFVPVPIASLDLTDKEKKGLQKKPTGANPLQLESKMWGRLKLLELHDDLEPLKVLVNKMSGRGVHSPLSPHITVETPWGAVTHVDLAAHLEDEIDEQATELNQLRTKLSPFLKPSTVSSAQIHEIAANFIDQLGITSQKRKTHLRAVLGKKLLPLVRDRLPALRELRIRLLTSPLPPALKPGEQTLLEHELLLCVALGLAADLERLGARAAGAKTWSGKSWENWKRELEEITQIANDAGLAVLSPLIKTLRGTCLGHHKKPTAHARTQLERFDRTMRNLRDALSKATLSSSKTRVARLSTPWSE